jgi:hypothetical protein
MYKVVGTEYCSFISVASYPGLIYKVGETTFPNYGKIFVFDKLSDAIRFAKSSGNVILFGEGENPHKLNFMPTHKDEDRFFWKLRKNKKKVVGVLELMKTPPGTYVVDSFKPLEYFMKC